MKDIEPPRFKSVSQWIWALSALIGLALLLAGVLRTQRMVACRSWPMVQGAVEVSELQRGFMREGSLKYKPRVVYQYTVGSKSLRSDRISFVPQPRDMRHIRDLVRLYHKGRTVTVHYHPDAPHLAVLDITWSWSALKPLILGLLLTPLCISGLYRRWPLQTDYLFRERDPDAPLTWKHMLLGSLGLLACLGIAWIWWELIKMYAGR